MAHTVERFAWYDGNSMIVQLGTPGRPLRDTLTGGLVTTAVVTCQAFDALGVPLAGISWPQTLAHVGGGIYRVSIPPTVALPIEELGTVDITMTLGAETAMWTEEIIGMART